MDWQLTAQEAAHAMPVLQSTMPELRAAPAPRLALIRNLARRSGIRDGTLRTALSRACASGSLEAADGRYRLGPASLEEAARTRAFLARTPGYALAVVLEGEGSDLPRLRELFARFGFRPLQRSVWVGARTPDDRLSAALEQAGLGGSTAVFQADEVDTETRAKFSRLWRLPERAEELRRFHHQLMTYLTEPKTGSSEAAWRCVEAAPIWHRVAVIGEPPFPLDLCGGDYPLDRLNGDWFAHLQSMSQALLALWTADEQ